LVRDKEKVLIVGSGIAGLTVARDLAREGYASLVLEKADQPGGWVAHYTCKAIEGRCQKCGACLVEEAIAAALDSPLVEMAMQTTITGLQERDGSIFARVKRGEEEGEKRFSAVILCHGFQPFDPKLKPHLGYGRIPNLITGRALEQILRKRGEVVRPSDKKKPSKMAFVQCVGSRETRLGHPYCSQVCCGYALRMARQIKARDPDMDITFFYMDIQTFGRDFAVLWPELQAEINLIRQIPGDFFPMEGARVGVAAEIDDRMEDLGFDLMVLSVGMAPSEDQAMFQGWLDLSLSQEGFLMPSRGDGVFVVGSASGPMGIVDTIAHAHSSVGEILDYLEALE
jgi:heterodisulfide reductase subunit A